MRVAVVGLGAAGIWAASQLERHGVDLRLFEARRRVGGRLLTVGGESGPLYEAGGEWIDSDHTRVLALAHEFGFEVDPTPRWPGLVFYRGEICPENEIWPDAFEDELRLLSVADDLCNRLNPVPWENQHFSSLDDVSLHDFIRENATSERGQWWLGAKYRSDEGDDVERVGLLGWLLTHRLYMARGDEAASAFRIAGGMGALFEAVASGLRTPIHFGMPLCRIIHEGKQVLLQFEDGEAAFDRVLLTVPPPALERIVFDPALPSEKRCAIEASEMGRSIKIALQFERPWWKDSGWSGSLFCDLPIQQCWDASRGEASVLCCYVCGRDSEHFRCSRSAPELALEQLATLFPEAPKHFVCGAAHDWSSEAFSKGGFSHLPKGYVMSHLQHIGAPLDRVHFAGEYAANWNGFIEGALESADRAVEEILNG